MTGILITGHGRYASGLLSSMKLVFGSPELVKAVDFEESQGVSELRDNLSKAVEDLGEEVLILTDVLGGSPHNQSVMLKMETENKKIEVISGTNLPMLLTAVLSRDGKEFDDLAGDVLEEGKKSIALYRYSAPVADLQGDDDGI